LGTEGQL